MDNLIWYPGHELILHNIVRAEGPYVFDGTGRRWLDLESGVWAASRILSTCKRQELGDDS